MKKTMIIGASGTIGQAIMQDLQHDTDLIAVGHTNGDYQVDLANKDSILTLFQTVGTLDAIVCAASRGVVLKPLEEMREEDYLASTTQKLFGQINVVLQGIKSLNDGGSITLTTGVFNREFIANGSAAAMVNSAVEGFVKAASLDMPRGIRINVVSPGLVEESAAKYVVLCPGFELVTAEKVARAYRKSIYGIQTGQVYCVG